MDNYFLKLIIILYKLLMNIAHEFIDWDIFPILGSSMRESKLKNLIYMTSNLYKI